MITEIFIENNRVDITADISSLLTFAIDDVQDFASRQTAFSKTIVLPGTFKNNKIFGNIFDTGIANDYNSALDNVGYNFNAAKSARCLVFQDNLQTFKGSIRLLQINKTKGHIDYEVALNGELTNLNIALTGAFLEDLDFSAYDETYSDTNIIASWDTFGQGVYYPMIDYGGYSTNKNDWDIKTFRPAFYVKEYIDKMFEGAGYRYQSNIINSARFKRMVIPYNRKILTKKGTGVMEASITSTKLNPDLFAWDAITGSLFVLASANKEIKYTAAPATAGTLNVEVTGTFSHADLVVRFYKNGVMIMEKIITWNGFSVPQFFGYTQSLPISFTTNDVITCNTTLINTSTGYTRSITKNTVSFVADVVQDVEVNYLDTITMNDAIPRNIRQVDFLTSIVKLFNLYVFESPLDDRLIKIEPFVDFYSMSSSASVDWTYKLNRDKPITIRPMSELNSKIYEFLYTDDTDFYNDLYKKRYNSNYGSHVFDSEFEFATQTNKLQVIFAPTPLVGYAGEEKIYPTIFKKSGTTEEQVDSVIRILQTKKIEGVSAWDIKNGVTVLSSPTDYGYAGHFDDPDNPDNDLNFGLVKELFFVLAIGNISKTQFNLYWSSYMAEITDKDSKMLTARFYLTAKDIYELDFSKYVYLDGVLFRLNKIEDYNISNPSDCVVELLKVIQTSYSFPPAPIGTVDYFLLWNGISALTDYDNQEILYQ